jgi:hypothetical protein
MKRLAWIPGFGLTVLLVGTSAARAGELKILLPLGRVAYQTNEWIDVCVLRSGPSGLQAGPLLLTLTGEDGSRLEFTFRARAIQGTPALASENLHVNGYLLRPGKYTVRVAVDGATAQTKIEVCSHVRKSSFKVIDWASRAAGPEQRTLGEQSLGFNTILYAYGGIDVDAMIRGGIDYMRNCAMGGSHWVDLRRECDWCDPYVMGGAIARLSRQAFQDRTNPNCIGVHIYDEPLLAEVKDPHDPTGKKVVHYGVPAQERTFKATFGHDAPKFGQIHFDRAEDAERWMRYNRWRLLLLEAAWKLSCYSINAVRPDFLPISQTQWAWQDFDGGYYFNVNRPYPVVSRHALYDYKYGGDFSPSFAFEFGRIRELSKPNWYLPMWGCGRSDLFRAEQYLSFIENLQGIAKPPDLLAHRPSQTNAEQAIVESNQLMARLGTVFETLPVNRSDVAVLYSMSHNLHEKARKAVDSYRGNGHFQRLLYLYMASKILHVPIFPVVEEDVLDGTLARLHKIVLLAGIDYLDAKVLGALQDYIAAGGTVLLSDDSEVHVAGAQRFHLPLDGVRLNGAMDQWAQEKQWGKWSEVAQTNRFFKAAQVVARALGPTLEKEGVRPVFECDQPGVVASRQAWGAIEYLFAVNASPDFDTAGWYYLKTVSAALGLAVDGRPVYDAVRGGRLKEFQQDGGKLRGHFRFGPGQMRVFARTARPIGGVQVLTPLLSSDYTTARNPLRVEINALLVDDRRQVLCGSAPLRIEVTDPLKVRRYELYRATDRGMLRLTLPLAANDPAGAWTVRVRELLGNCEGHATFHYEPASQCAAAAGVTRRATCFGDDREHIFHFFQSYKELTIVKGAGPFNAAAAERLAQSLAPRDVRCKIVDAAKVQRRMPTPEEKPTWVDDRGSFDLRGPAVLLGNPDDNPLIRHLLDGKFLPYTPVRDQFPGRGRGLIAWQRDGLGYWGQESLTLIGYDEAGLGEAVGSAYEIAAGMEPLTPWVLPHKAVVTAPSRVPEAVSDFEIAWRVAFPDRPAAIRALADGVLVISEDGTLRLLQAGGTCAWQKTFAAGESPRLEVAGDGRTIVVGSGHRLHVLDAGGREHLDLDLDPLLTKGGQYPEGLNALAVAPDGRHILVAFGSTTFTTETGVFANTLALIDRKGGKLWAIGGLDVKSQKPVLGDRYHFASFTPDGKKIVVLAEKKTQVIDVASGTVDKTLEGPTYGAACWHQAKMLLADGEGKVVPFSPAEGKIVNSLDCAKAGPAVLLPATQGVLLGTEADGAVRLVKGVAGKLHEQTVWHNVADGKIVKALAVNGEQSAVTYWGGTLRLLDRDGKLLQERVFPQDITGIAWLGGRLVIGLADGDVLALSPR